MRREEIVDMINKEFGSIEKAKSFSYKEYCNGDDCDNCHLVKYRDCVLEEENKDFENIALDLLALAKRLKLSK